jgi:hypothetical protein
MKPSSSSGRGSTPAPARRTPQDTPGKDASDPRRPIPRDPGKTTDVEIEKKPRRPRRG